MRIVLYIVLGLSSFYLGNLYGASKESNKRHLCATYKEKNMELVVDGDIYSLMTDKGQILGLMGREEVEEMLKDSRLTFHACKK